MKLQIFCDGGARGNPGPAAIGFLVFTEEGKLLQKRKQAIGVATNNEAEYGAVVEALKWLKEFKKQVLLPNRSLMINFFLDSQLVVNQLNGLFKVKEGRLRQLIVSIRQLEQEAGGNIAYYYIRREKNLQADFLVKQVLNSLKNEAKE